MKTALLCATTLAVCAAALTPAFALTVTPSGFTDAAGQTLVIRGMNANVQDAPRIFNNLQHWFPGMTMLRLNCDAGRDSASDIARIVSTYTGAGIIVEVEDHSSDTSNNVAWYAQMAGMFKDNPLVMMETANEPRESNVVNVQIGMIRAIRGAGFNNPIGVQPANGFDTSTIPAVLAAVGTTNIYMTPHIYYSANDPNGAAQYAASEIAEAQRNGVFAVIDEFGDSIDGPTPDPLGHATIQAVIDANEAGKAGAAYWEAWNDNGYMAEPDAVCFTIDCSQLTNNGASYMLLWLGKRDPSQLTMTTVAGVIGPIQAQAGAVNQQIDAAQKVADGVPAPRPQSTSAATPAATATAPVRPTTGQTAPPPADPAQTMPPAARAELGAAEADIKAAEAEIGALLSQISAMQAHAPYIASPPVPAPPVDMQVPMPVQMPAQLVQVPVQATDASGGNGGGGPRGGGDSDGDGGGGAE